MKNKILFAGIIVLIALVVVFALQFYPKSSEDNFDEQLRRIRDAYHCDAYPGDPLLVFGIVKESETSSFETFRSYCEQLPDCEWRGLGGKIDGYYACCPTNVDDVPIDTLPESVKERCLIMID